MTQDDIKAMAVKLSMLIDSFETRGDKVVQQNTLAAEAIGRAAQGAAQVASQVSARAIEDFRQAAGSALNQGLRKPLEQMDQQLQASMTGVRQATDELERRIQTAGRIHTATAWKMFIASAFASLTVIAVAAYVALHTRTELANAQWAGQINAAIASGNLAPCVDGGLCARVDGKRWVRLDQTQYSVSKQ
jgi:hypothetical protein